MKFTRGEWTRVGDLENKTRDHASKAVVLRHREIVGMENHRIWRLF
jgi:hypothetical protein